MRARGEACVLVTRDKDLAQLVREGDEFWDFAGDRRYGYGDIAGQFGVRPERMADYLALTGDSVDNIPGVPGVGPKTAAVLLDAFESLEGLYARLGEVPSLPLRGAARLPARLEEHRAAAFLARRLTRIACDMPLAFDPAELVRRAPALDALEAFYDHAGFGSMLRRQAHRIAERL
jgi:5'-3' exonuclease